MKQVTSCRTSGTRGQLKPIVKDSLLKPKIPAFGYRQIRIMQGDPLQIKNSARAENNILENEYLQIQILCGWKYRNI